MWQGFLMPTIDYVFDSIISPGSPIKKSDVMSYKPHTLWGYVTKTGRKMAPLHTVEYLKRAPTGTPSMISGLNAYQAKNVDRVLEGFFDTCVDMNSRWFVRDNQRDLFVGHAAYRIYPDRRVAARPATNPLDGYSDDDSDDGNNPPGPRGGGDPPDDDDDSSFHDDDSHGLPRIVGPGPQGDEDVISVADSEEDGKLPAVGSEG